MFNLKLEIKEIPGYPGYFVDIQGNVYSNKRGFFKKLGVKISEYRSVNLFKTLDNNIWRRDYKKVCWLVLETFVGPRPDGYQACHGIKGKLDDSLSNLSWGTRQQNMKDKIRDGTDNRGIKNNRAKLTEEQVLEIRKLGKLYLQKDLARMFNVTDTLIGNILRRESWKHL
jgi:hypothetical protein